MWKEGDIMTDKPGKPIRGSLKPFRKILDLTVDDVITPNGIGFLRDDLKDCIAQRMRYTKCKPIDISDECVDNIHHYIKDPQVFTFVRCCIRYYNGSTPHRVTINTDCASCKSKDEDKSLQHARQDTLKCLDWYLRVAKRKLEYAGIPYDVSHIERATKFFSSYVYSMHKSELPQELTSELYDRIFHKYMKISDIYQQKYDDCYFRKKKVKYSALPLDIATEVFCADFFRVNLYIN